MAALCAIAMHLMAPTAAADTGQRVLVVPLGGAPGGALAGAPAQLTGVLVRTLDVFGADVTEGQTSLDDTLAIVGCASRTVRCLEQAAVALEVDQLVFGSVRPGDMPDTLLITVTLATRGEGPVRRRIVIQAATVDEAVQAFAEEAPGIFGRRVVRPPEEEGGEGGEDAAGGAEAGQPEQPTVLPSEAPDTRPGRLRAERARQAEPADRTRQPARRRAAERRRRLERRSRRRPARAPADEEPARDEGQTAEGDPGSPDGDGEESDAVLAPEVAPRDPSDGGGPARFALERVQPSSWAIAGVGGGLMGTGVIFWMLARQRQGMVDDAPASTAAELERLVKLEDGVRNRAFVGNTLVAAGAVTAAIGLAFAIRDARTPGEAEVAVTPVATRDSVGVVLGMRWAP